MSDVIWLKTFLMGELLTVAIYWYMYIKANECPIRAYRTIKFLEQLYFFSHHLRSTLFENSKNTYFSHIIANRCFWSKGTFCRNSTELSERHYYRPKLYIRVVNTSCWSKKFGKYRNKRFSTFHVFSLKLSPILPLNTLEKLRGSCLKALF